MANRRYTQFMNSLHPTPVLLDCNFVVDHSNGNGLGIRNLKGPGIAAVYMNTSATPATGNPNPAAGYIMVQLEDNYNRSLSGFNAIVSPVSGTPLTSVSANLAYTIVSLGTATLAQWQAVGLPPGLTPTVGQSFIATATQSIGGSAAVEVPATAGSGITNIETVGDPNQTLSPVGLPQGQGGFLILQCMKNTVLTAPADNSVISLAFYLSNSSVNVKGE